MDVSPEEGGTAIVDGTVPTEYPFASTFENGTGVSLEAVPAPGYEFTRWSGDLSGTASPVTIQITCNKSVIAVFSPLPPPETNESLVGGIAGGIIIVGLIIAVWIGRRRA